MEQGITPQRVTPPSVDRMSWAAIDYPVVAACIVVRIAGRAAAVIVSGARSGIAERIVSRRGAQGA
jgi:hypothetical protein